MNKRNYMKKKIKNKAQKVAEQEGDPCRQSKHGCVIYKGGRILSTGYNDYTPHPRGGGYSNGRHAEMMAIDWAENRGISLVGAKLFVCRLNGTQMSRPCKDCMKRIKEAGIKRVLYTTKNGKIIREIVR